MLTDVAKNKMITSISEAIDRVFISASEAITTSTLISTITNQGYPTNIPVVWGTATAGVIKTTNKTENDNPMNFAMIKNATPKKIVFYLNGSNYPAIIEDLPVSVPTNYAYQGPLFIDEYSLTITEV